MTFAEITALIGMAVFAITFGVREGIFIWRWIRAQPIRLRPRIEVNNDYLLCWLTIVLCSVAFLLPSLILALMINTILIMSIVIAWVIIVLIQLRIHQ